MAHHFPPDGESADRILPQLDESEHGFRKLVEALPDAILIHSDDTIVFVNPCCVRLFAAEVPQQLLGKNISKFISPEYLGQVRDRVRDCYSTGLACPPMESVVIACDGSPVEIEAVAIPIAWNGSPAIEVVLREITVRKRAEKKAEEWQRRLELAQKAGLRIGLWDWNFEANTVTWSDESYRQFGYTPESFSGRVDEALTRIHPEDRPRVEAAIQKVLSDHGEYAAQYRLVRPDGTTCWIDAHGVIVRNGSPHMIGVGVDITDVKNAQKALLQSEEKYLLLLNSTAEAIYGLDLKGNCTFCNPACVHLLGHASSEELLGKNMHALMHHTRIDGTPYPRKECEIYLAIREGRATHVSHEVLWRADGTSFPAEYWSYPMYRAGELVGAVVTFLDVSERRRAEQALQQSEEKYRHLFENAIYGIFRSTVSGELLDVNPALVSMLGYDSKQELLTRNLGTDVYRDPAARKSVLERYGPGGRVDGAEVNWRRKDGSIINVRLCGGMVRRDDGSLSHYEVIVEDITARRDLEEQLRQAQKMEAIGLLAGGISHDFNNLLSVILGNAELLVETTESGTHRHYAEEIQKASRLAAQLTRQLLAFSRKEVLCPTVLDVNAIVRDVCEILQRVLGEDIRIVADLGTGMGSIRADRGQVEQLLMNLATNARDAMPNGGTFSIRTDSAEIGSQEASLYPDVQAGRYVRLTVSDTGVGMSEQLRVRIFEPFFTTKPLGRGTGLGLATVYGVVKNSGGFIRVSSSPGAGTAFHIHFPCVEQRAVSPVFDLREKSGGFRETVLLLEDEEAVRLVTTEFLAGSGYRVLQAGSGYRAIEVARQHQGPIHLIISDVVLPDLNGPSAVMEVQSLHPEAQALYVSGYADAPAAQQLISEGAIFLQKPVSRRDLLERVDEMLHFAATIPS